MNALNKKFGGMQRPAMSGSLPHPPGCHEGSSGKGVRTAGNAENAIILDSARLTSEPESCGRPPSTNSKLSLLVRSLWLHALEVQQANKLVQLYNGSRGVVCS